MLKTKQELSPVQVSILRETAHGKTQSEIAITTGRSVRTVKAQLTAARNKLGARNTTHAVAIAIIDGLI